MSSSAEIVLVVTPRRPQRVAGPVESLLGAFGGAATKLASAVDNAVASVVNGTLDRVVPVTLAAILDRMDLTSIVISRVDLTRVVQATLDQMDLTELVLARVDIDRLVEGADLDPIIDRLPLVSIANFLIDEIDLPKIIRESTGGIASDAMNVARIQAIDADQFLARITDAILLRRRARATATPAASVDPQEPS